MRRGWSGDEASLASTCSGLHVLCRWCENSLQERTCSVGRFQGAVSSCGLIGCRGACVSQEGRNDQYQSGAPDSRIGCQRGFDSCLCCRRAAAARRAYQPVGVGNGLRDATVVVRDRPVLGGSSIGERFDGRDSILRLNLCFAD